MNLKGSTIAKDALKLVVVGSSNMDLVVRSPRIPVSGETILGGDFLMVPGGKGANQAVAMAKLGAHAVFVARLGDDLFGHRSLENFQKERVDTRFVALTRMYLPAWPSSPSMRRATTPSWSPRAPTRSSRPTMSLGRSRKSRPRALSWRNWRCPWRRCNVPRNWRTKPAYSSSSIRPRAAAPAGAAGDGFDPDAQ